MPLSRTIRDIYIPLREYPNIRDSATLNDAIAMLHNAFSTGKRFRHVLVLNDQDELIGILGMRDILHGLFPDYLRTREHPHHAAPIPDFPSLALIWAKTCHTQVPEAAKKPVKDLIGTVRGKVGIDDLVTKAAYLLVIHDTSVLPVVDGNRLVGVVRMVDVFNEASKMVCHD